MGEFNKNERIIKRMCDVFDKLEMAEISVRFQYVLFCKLKNIEGERKLGIYDEDATGRVSGADEPPSPTCIICQWRGDAGSWVCTRACVRTAVQLS